MNAEIEQSKRTLIGVAIVLFVLFLARSPIERILRAYHLLPEPEPLTELYFEDHLTLPKTFKLGVPQKVKFTIHNVMYEQKIYTVDVTAKTATQSSTIQHGDVILPHDAYKTLTADITLTEATRTAVMVSLHTGEKIQLWLDPQ